MCRRALAMPETIEEKALKKDLLDRIKKHIKVVLRKADKAKIPMEIPEARELATIEIIEAESKLERARVKEEMLKKAQEITDADETKAKLTKANEEKFRKARKNWAATVLQSHYRGFKGKQTAREWGYKRYKKHFDVNTIEYFYEDVRTKKTTWKKPYVFGSYDIDPDEGWVIMRDTSGDVYYYNPRSWAMQWELPMDSKLCEECNVEFAVAKLSANEKIYCDGCMYIKIQDMAQNGVSASEILYKPFKVFCLAFFHTVHISKYLLLLPGKYYKF